MSVKEIKIGESYFDVDGSYVTVHELRKINGRWYATGTDHEGNSVNVKVSDLSE